jgi:drug/metabolite transporter (DMT)-like permease
MPQRNSNEGLLFALAGFVCLTLGDAIIKSIGGEWPGPAVAALRYCIGAAGLGTILWMKEGRGGFTLPLPKIQLMRGFAVAFATLSFFLAIFAMPLAEATAIVFVSPMITAILSALLLDERAGKSTWISSAIAFAGVLLILRPNVSVLGWPAFLPLLAAFGMALLMIGNRKVANAGSALQMQFLIAAIAAPILVAASVIGHFSGATAFHVTMPDWTIILRCFIVAITASSSHWLLYISTTKASAAHIAPMVYVQIIIALAIGILFFGDWPDTASLAGTAIIIGAGVYLWNSKRAPETGRNEV